MRTDVILETTGQDWANHLSHELSGSGTICFAVMLSEKPDAEILYRAAEDVIALQPVLGCRFDTSREPPVFTPLEGNDWFSQAMADDAREGLNAFLQNAMPRERQMELRLLSCPGQSVLCLRFDHAATDGGGVKVCLSLLSDCYNRRCAGEKPPKSAVLDRSDTPVFTKCGIADFRMAIKREAPPSGIVKTVPYNGMDGNRVRHCWVSLPLSKIKRPGFTINDQLLAAYALALYDEGQKEEGPVTIHMTVDLRRYLDIASAPAACNLSGMEAVTAAVPTSDPFASTLKAMREQTVRIKSGRPGLGSAAMMAYLRTMPYCKVREILQDAAEKTRRMGMAAPILSNLGRLSQEPLCFGDATATSILPLLPAMYAPAFMLGAGSYGDTLTLSAGFYQEEREADRVMRLLLSMREKLLESAEG